MKIKIFRVIKGLFKLVYSLPYLGKFKEGIEEIAKAISSK